MGIKKWSEFDKNDEKTNEGLKTFSKSKKTDPETKEKPQRAQSSASSEYADEVNQNIIKQKQRKSRKNEERKYDKTRRGQGIVDKSILPPGQGGEESDEAATANWGDGSDVEGALGTSKVNEKHKDDKHKDVEIYGRVAKFPEGVKASKAYNWMHNLQDPKLAKKDIWYLMVEKQDNELQMIKYQQKQGVNLTHFVTDLKKYYARKYKDQPKLAEKISKIKLGGDKEGNFSAITNIPNVKVENGRKLIHKITEDLVKLLG